MANQIDFIVRNGLQVTTNAVVGTYAMTNAAPINGLIVSGDVGIGTALPTSKLEVRGNIQLTNTAATISGIRFADGTFQNTSAESYSTPPGGNTDSIQFNAGGVPAAFGGSAEFVFHSGNTHVGIGTSRAEYALHVSASDGAALFSTLNGADYQINVGKNVSNGNVAVLGYSETGQYAYITTGNNQPSPILAATQGGRVGIGTSIPVNRLDVSGAVTVGAGYAGSAAAPLNGISVEGNVAVGSTTTTARLGLTPLANQTAFLIGAVSSANYYIRAIDGAGQDKFLVNSSGNIVAGGWQGNAIMANYGGTGLTTYTTGDLLYATSSATTLSKLAIGPSGNVLISNGTSPYWGNIALSGSGISGILPVSKGGTNVSAFSGKAVIVSDATGTSLSDVTSAANAAVVFDQTGTPTSVTGGPYTYLTTGAGGGNLSFGKVDVANGVTGSLQVANGGTGLTGLAQYSLIYGSGNTSVVGTIASQATSAFVTGVTGAPQWTSGSVANRVLRTDGTSITFAQIALATDVSGILPYANGGTNVSTSFTQGSIIFAGATGFAQDNGNFYWDDSNDRLGLGTTAPTTTLDVNGAATIRNGANVVAGGLYVQAGVGNFAASLIAANVTSNGFVNGASVYSSGAISAVGTITGANIQGNSWIRSANFYGSGTINTDGAATFASITSNAEITAASIYSSGGINSADGIIGDTIASNTTINAGGTVFVGALISNSTITGGAFQSNSSITANTFVANTSIDVNGTAESFNTLTGALTVAGGVGIASNLHVGGQTVLGGNVTIAGNLTVLGNATIINTEELSVEDPLIQIGTGPAGQPLQSDDGLDRGIIMHQYRAGSGGDTHSYLGREDSSGRLLFITNVQPGAANIANPIRVNSPGYHWGTANFGNLILSGGANAVSVSTSTGALVLEGTGGAGIGGGLHVGEYAYVGLGFNTGGTATVNRLVSNTAISAGTIISAPGQISGGSIVSNSSLQTNTLTANSGAYIGGGLNVVGTITAGGLVLNAEVTFSNISASGTISGNVLIGNIGVYSGGNINAVNTVFGGAIVSNSFINGTSINSSGPLSAAGTITGANIVSNGFVQGTSIYSSGPISAAGAITGASLTSNGLTSTSTFYASGTVNGGGGAIFNSVTSNTFIVGASISSSGAISAAGTGTFANVTSNGWVQTTALNSSGAILGANITSNGFIFGSSLNTSGTATVNALVSNGVVSGASISTAGGITGGTINGALLVSNAGISAGTTVSAPGQITGGSIVSNSSVTGNVLTANSAVNTLALNATGSVRFTSGNTTTSSTTGALVVTGGIATSNNLFVAGSTWTGNISVTNATASTSRTTGALTVAGGVGIDGALFVGETLDARSITNTAIGNIVPSTGQFTTLQSQNTATVNALISNSFINGTSLYSSGPVSAAGTGTFANVTSNGFVNGASVYSSGAISAAGTITANRLQSNTAVVGATIQGSTSMLTGTFVANTSITTAGLLASGEATVNSLVTNTSVTGNTFILNGNVATTSTTGAVTLDTFAASEYRTAHYLVQVTDNTALQYHSTQIFLIHNGTNVYQSEYNLIFTDAVLGTFDSSLVSGQIALTFTATSATNKTIKVLRTGIEV